MQSHKPSALLASSPLTTRMSHSQSHLFCFLHCDLPTNIRAKERLLAWNWDDFTKPDNFPRGSTVEHGLENKGFWTLEELYAFWLMGLFIWLLAQLQNLKSKIKSQASIHCHRISKNIIQNVLKGHCHDIWQLNKKLEGVFASMEFQN